MINNKFKPGDKVTLNRDVVFKDGETKTGTKLIILSPGLKGAGTDILHIVQTVEGRKEMWLLEDWLDLRDETK